MKSQVTYWVEKVGEFYEVWAYHSYYDIERLIKTYRTKKAADAYVAKVNARLNA